MSDIELISVKVKREDDDFIKISFENFLDKSLKNDVMLDNDTALDMAYVIKQVVLDS